MENGNDPLKLCKKFFSYLNQNKIQYCHWKSNNHLEKGLKGETDLDLLIDEGDRERLQQALSKYRFIRILSHYLKQYPGMEDYLGFDSETGKLIHLHVHYKLILGQKYIKNHHLPLEKLVLKYSRERYGVKIPCPEMELLLLVIRSCMKFGIRNIMGCILRRSPSLFPKDIFSEFQFLLQDSEDKKFGTLIEQSNLKLSAQQIFDFIDCLKRGEITLFKILSLRHYIFQTLRPFRRHPPFLSLKKLIRIYIHKLPIFKKFWPISGKRLDAYGKSFGIVGADGSGKSTILKDLDKWLSWKLEVRTFYFGIPKTYGLKLIRGITVFLRILSDAGFGKTLPRLADKLKKYISSRRWIWVAKKRLVIFHELEKFTRIGGVVITDRYPLPQFWDMRRPMDGPRIKIEYGNTTNEVAKQEEYYYSRIGLPTKILVLQTNIDELRRRKGDLPQGDLIMKADAINHITSAPGICCINGNQSYSKVLQDIKEEIWESL